MYVLVVLEQPAMPSPVTMQALDEPPPVTDESQKIVRPKSNRLAADLKISHWQYGPNPSGFCCVIDGLVECIKQPYASISDGAKIIPRPFQFQPVWSVRVADAEYLSGIKQRCSFIYPRSFVENVCKYPLSVALKPTAPMLFVDALLTPFKTAYSLEALNGLAS